MSRVLVLGGAGQMGRRAVACLAEQGHEVVVGDVRPPAGERRRFVQVDASDQAEVRRAAAGADAIMNFSGPFYALGDAAARAAIASGIPYLDICDDAHATLALLGLDEEARAAGVPLVIGAGSSPGIVNALALRAADGYDELDELVLTWVVGEYGPAGVAPLRHFFFGITQEIPVWRDGAEAWVPAFTRESEEEFQFPAPLGRFAVRDVGHPETVTLPRVLKVRSVRNKGALLPPSATGVYELLKRLGLLGDESVEVGGVPVVARDFVAAFLTQRHNRRAADGRSDVMGFGVRAEGLAGGRRTRREIATAANMTMGDATSVPAAAAMPQLLGGTVPAGVHGPEVLEIPAWFDELARLQPGLYANAEVAAGDGSARVATSLAELARRPVAELLSGAKVG